MKGLGKRVFLERVEKDRRKLLGLRGEKKRQKESEVPVVKRAGGVARRLFPCFDPSPLRFLMKNFKFKLKKKDRRLSAI